MAEFEDQITEDTEPKTEVGPIDIPALREVARVFPEKIKQSWQNIANQLNSIESLILDDGALENLQGEIRGFKQTLEEEVKAVQAQLTPLTAGLNEDLAQSTEPPISATGMDHAINIQALLKSLNNTGQTFLNYAETHVQAAITSWGADQPSALGMNQTGPEFVEDVLKVEREIQHLLNHTRELA